jgi:hypothetical protein
MGRQAPDGLLGVHMNLLVTTLGGAMLPAESQQERAAAGAIATFRTSGFGYFLEQATRPQTIGYALLDSPAALAAWMLDHDTEVFAIGDMMALNQLLGVPEVAMQSGIHAANTIKRRLNGKDAAPFNYRDLGSMATISRFRAVVSFKGLRLSGFPSWLMWLVVHITFLTGFKNRFTSRQVMARVAIEQIGGEKFMEALMPAHTTGAEQVTQTAPLENG